MTFRGWPIEAVEFYEGLEADNSRAYWQDHKEHYERFAKEPMAELLAELADEFGEGRIFRPYRDVRFSKDKTPYKTSIAAQMPGGYVSMSADGLFVGAGLYMPDPDQLRRYREAVDGEASGNELEEIVSTLRSGGYDVGGAQTLKTAPRGYPKDHPRIALLQQKGVIMSRSWPVGAWLGTRKAKDKIVTGLRAAGPLRGWIARHAT